MKVLVPLAAVLTLAGYFAWRVRPPKAPADGMNIHEAGRIVAVDGGRRKPLDTVARTALRVISDREYYVDENGDKQPAIRWLLDVLVDSKNPRGRTHKVFRIYDEQIRAELGLFEIDARMKRESPPKKRDGYRYAMSEFGDRLGAIIPDVKQAHEKKEAKRPLVSYERNLLELWTRLKHVEPLMQLESPHLVPPSEAGAKWQTLPAVRELAIPSPHAEAFDRILDAYAAGQAAKFNEEVAAYLARLEGELPKDVRKAWFESFYNHVDALNVCKHFYLLAFLMSCLAWIVWPKTLDRTAHALLWMLWIVHTVALVARIYLSGRPPVTNLYSSAVFIGWGAVFVGLVLERFFRLGVGNTIAAAAGFLTLFIAPFLAADGDTMEVLQAVLDTQFWLATHVTTITTGYTTTYVSGLIGIIFILRGVLTPTLTTEVRSTLARMMYGTLCFAMFFSFVGTVLGGLWADDSWGRFWGWDPKENGALIIVLWNALILHARWGGLVRDRGLAVMAVFGNVVTSWSYFGVNLLGAGLHNYGFMEGHAWWLGVFIVSQLIIMGLGLLPERFWASRLAPRGAHGEAA